MSKRIVVLKNYEYLVDAEDPTGKHYEVFYKKEKLDDVTKIVRLDVEEFKNEVSRKHNNKKS